MTTPPTDLVKFIQSTLRKLLEDNPLATSSEKYIQHHVEFSVLQSQLNYHLRIGINYHGNKVQEIKLRNGKLYGWNREGNALGRGANAKLLLGGFTIVDRDDNEPLMNDSKFAGGQLRGGEYIRTEFKTRGWLGQTRNLDGKQLEKDIDLLKENKADLLVVLLSEVAYLKWRGEGDDHNAARRTGTTRFKQIFSDLPTLEREKHFVRQISFEDQVWQVEQDYVIGSDTSPMPGALHISTLIWRL